ncbi:MAG: 16S rRNA (cytidine(1402)-2'-O)-methyltransferase [Candidatus Omnitrophica bacterium]|nr:16S rRNA (cytidine(1402)-2'-O)-methyltransferase [Candidatus Omnitrophota bacterium]MBI3010297.1 16S rRNA (cytidine(1402)-2'-O)-methyltransferase [Candidatus Omnitrophota bacterium]
MRQEQEYGTLYLVATPIGNLKDITLRALETLQSVDTIACEDTRRTLILLRHYKIEKPLVSLHDHNERARTAELLKRLKEKRSVALVSDGGTPLLSDPGWWLTQQALKEEIPVTWIPGATAFVGGLVLSGLAVEPFVFEGFLPMKAGARTRRLQALKDQTRTVVLYESPHRLLKLLQEIQSVLGEAPIACARELTKVFEEVFRGTVSQAIDHFTQHPPRGEFVIVVKPTAKDD